MICLSIKHCEFIKNNISKKKLQLNICYLNNNDYNGWIYVKSDEDSVTSIGIINHLSFS